VFDPTSLLLLDAEAERMLAAWPLVRGERRRRRGASSICGWSFDVESWMRVAAVSRAAVTRFSSMFDRLAFIGASGELEEPVAAYLRRRVASRLGVRTTRPAPARGGE
jgi:hypothetical protein